MPITLRDGLSFPFNAGRGITPPQIDWEIADDGLNTLLTTIAVLGNIGYVLDGVPHDDGGNDGDTAIVRFSDTELRGYIKREGAWIQIWEFSAGGAGLTSAFINALPVGEIHSNSNWPFVDANGVLSHVPFSTAVAFMRSSAGLGRQLNPRPAEATAGFVPIAIGAGNGYSLKSTDSLKVVQSAIHEPSAAEEYRLLWNLANRQLEIYVNHPHRTDTAEGTWSFIPDRNDLYIEESRAQVSGQDIGDFVWDAGAGSFYLWTAVFAGDNRWAFALPAEALAASRKLNTNAVIWLGSAPSNDAALNHVINNHHDVDLATTDVFYNNADTILRMDTYVAPGTRIDHWVLVPSVRNPVPDPVDQGIIVGGNGAWGVGRLPERGDSFPHVTKLPGASASSPDLVYLEHQYSEGNRADGVLRIGSAGVFSGYVDSRLGETVGSINKPVPVVRIRVVLTGVVITRWDDIEFFEEDTANEFDRIWLANNEYTLGDVFFGSGLWHRRFTSEPNLLEIDMDIAFNLRRTDGGTYFLTDGTGVIHDSGFYGKYQVREGEYAYDQLSGPRIAHTESVGEPIYDPTRTGQFDVDDLGRVWVGLVDRHLLTTEASATSEELRFDQYVRSPISAVELFAQGGNGAFTWAFLSGNKDLIQIPSGNPGDYDEHRTWLEVWGYLKTRHAVDSENYNDAVANEAALWLGGFSNQQKAAEEASHLISQEDYDAGRRIFYGHTSLGPNQGIRRLTTYVQSVVTEEVDAHWIGPFATIDDLIDTHEPIDGQGAPAHAPSAGRRLAINDAGHLFASKDVDVTHTLDSSWGTAPTTVVWEHWKGVQRFYNSAVLTETNDFMFGASPRRWLGNDGSFSSVEWTNWRSVKAWFFAAVGRREGAPEGLFEGGFLAGPNLVFADDDEAVLFLQGERVSDTSTSWVYFVGTPGDYENWDFRLAIAGAYVAGEVVHEEVDSWNERFVTQADLRALPSPAGVGETRTVLFDGDQDLANATTVALTGDIVCPQTGDLHIFVRAIGGDRSGSVAEMRMPASDLYAAITNIGSAVPANGNTINMRSMGLGANRLFAISTATGTHVITVSPQNAGGAGDYYIRLVHIT